MAAFPCRRADAGASNHKARRMQAGARSSAQIADLALTDDNAIPSRISAASGAARHKGSGRCVTIPNLISIGRLFLVPLTIWLIVSDEPVTAFWIFILAGVSDAVDGFLARQFNMRSVARRLSRPACRQGAAGLDLRHLRGAQRDSGLGDDPGRQPRHPDHRRGGPRRHARPAGRDAAPDRLASSTPSPRSCSPAWCSAISPFAVDLSMLRQIMVVAVGILTDRLGAALCGRLGPPHGHRQAAGQAAAPVDERLPE